MGYSAGRLKRRVMGRVASGGASARAIVNASLVYLSPAREESKPGVRSDPNQRNKCHNPRLSKQLSLANRMSD